MITENQARRYAKLMGIVYGVIIAMEMSGVKPTYAEIERIMSQQQHCLPAELMQVCKELHRFNGLIEQAEKV